MATYSFPDVAGTSLVFLPAEDLLVFPAGWPAASLRFVVSGADLLVSSLGETVRLLGIGLGGAGLNPVNLVFGDGSLLVLDASGNNLRSGSAGADWIGVDRGGNDTVAAGEGDDFILAGGALTAEDAIDGGAGTGDTLAVSGTVSVVLGAGTVTAIERIEAAAGDVVLTLDAATVATATPAGGAVFTVDAGAQGFGSRLVVNGSAVVAAGMALLAGAGDDSLVGGAGADLLAGRNGDDSLLGGAGDDTLDGGAGADVLDGGAGDDLFRFDIVGPLSPPATPDLILGFEGAGRAGGDRIVLPPTVLVGRALAFHVGAADFAFEGYAESGVQLPAGRIGDGFADVLWRRVENAAWHFEVWADLNDDGRFGAGDLFLRIALPQGDGATTLGAGDFLAQFGGFVGSAAADTLLGEGATDDAMWGEAGDDVLSGGDGVDWLEGGPGDDTLQGGDLADELRGGPGSDWLEGGDGWDTLFAADLYTPETESAADRNMLLGGAGRDLLFGGAGLDTLVGGDDDDVLWGDAGDDSLDGGAGDDLLQGRDGDDGLSGGDGADTLVGGPGADVMQGGAGADLFVVDLSTQGRNETSGAAMDWLADFSAAAGDMISLGLVNGLVGGGFGPGTLAWRGALAARDAATGPGFDQALPGEGIGPGYYQAWWQPALLGGVAAGGCFIVDLDQDLILDADDAVLRIGGPGPDGAEALTPDAFAGGTFRVLVGGAGADDLTAAPAGQEIFGLDGADRLTGRGGNDRLVGGNGDDTLVGGLGADQLWGGAGNDLLDGEDGNDELFVEGPGLAEFDGFFARNTLSGGDGDDSLWGADGREFLDGGVGADMLYGGVGLDTLVGGGGADTLTGGDGADSLAGGDGADSILAGAGEDTVDYDPADLFADGGDDFDMLVLRAPAAVTLESAIDQVAGGGVTRGFEGVDASAVLARMTLIGTAGRNRLVGTGFADRLEGQDGADSLEGGAGADTLLGGAGDDVILGDLGGDWLDGGPGTDILSYAAATGRMTVSLASGLAFGAFGPDTLAGFEVLRGSGWDDVLAGGGASERIEGLGGHDSITGSEGRDTLIGGLGADTLFGDGWADSLLGGAGNDLLDGGDGPDVLDGGEGADTMRGQYGNDLFLVTDAGDRVIEALNRGDDTVIASVSHTLSPNVEWLVLVAGSTAVLGVGNTGANHIRGNELANRLSGLEGDDTLFGGAGNDLLLGYFGADVLFGEDGADSLYGSTGNDILDGGLGRDLLSGGDGNDTLQGGSDAIVDILYGGAGGDWLDGGPGVDAMYGGLGNDVFVVSETVETIVEVAGEGLDRVIVRASAAYTLPANVEYLALDGATAGIGNTLSNRITGSFRAESLFGRAGNDTLEGGGGDDALFGEAGRDAFLFGPGSSADAIRDFVPGEDRILLQGLPFTSFAELMAATRQGANGAIIDFGPTDAVLLAGVQKASLTAADIVFLP